ARTLSLKALSAGSLGMSIHWPDTSNFQPWYTQRIPHSSLRPKNSDAPRCGQLAASSPTRPRVSRKATRSSPSRRTFFGGQSGSGSSVEGRNGIQYWRSRSEEHTSELQSRFDLVCRLLLE